MNNIIKKAFTLVELLVVIAIVGILSGLIIVGMGSMTQSAAVAKGQVFSASIRDSLMSNLTSEWKFDADATDSWGANSGTITGATIVSTGCVYGSCLNVNNSTDVGSQYVSIADSTSLDSIFGTRNFTFDTWIYSSFKAYYQGIINKRASLAYIDSPAGIFIDNNGNTLRFLIGNAVTTNDVTYSIASMHNTWLNIVGTADGSNMKLYVNGSLVGSTAMTITPLVNNDPMTIGVFYAGARGFYGKVDNTRIYNATLPTSKIKEDYYAGLNRILSKGEIALADYQQRIK